MNICDFIQDMDMTKDFERPLDCIPYAVFLGLQIRHTDGDLITVMKSSPHLVGSPLPPTIHGGTIGAILEITGIFETATAMEAEHLPKIIDIDIDYLRPGKEVLDTHARARIMRMGRRFANVQVTAWQNNPANPIATARMNLLVAAG